VIAFVLLTALAAQPVEIPNVHSVYLLPMGGGLEQFVASRLTADNVLRVVADPKRADAVFTDRLGEALEQRLAELLGAEGGKARTEEPPRLVSSFGRGRGTIFLVDAKTRTVLWSAYEKPKNSTPDELNRTASRIVQRLKRDLSKE